jgi:mevalonate kinase
MSKYLGETSVPGVVALLGEYGLGYGEPALAVAIDRRVSIKAQSTDFDFFIVDDYKMDPGKHRILHTAVNRYWKEGPLEFNTSSELPVVSGLGTESALSVAVVGLLSELSKQPGKDKKQLPNHGSTKRQLENSAVQAFEMEKSLDDLSTPLRTTGAAFGGAIYIDTESKGAICSIPNKSPNLPRKSKKSGTWNVHNLSCNDDLALVIGYPKQKMDFSKAQANPLFSKPVKKSATMANQENISKKLHRLISRSGLAKDNLKDIGNLTRAGRQALMDGNYTGLGELMDKEQNLITMLGLCPQELRPIIAMAREKSVGVRLTGSVGDTLLAISQDPDGVVNDIKSAGFDAIKVNITHEGFIPKLDN